MPELEIHTVGGGYYLYDIFNYLAAFTGSSNFEALLYAGIVAGVLVASLQLVIFGAVRQVFTYFIGTVLVLGICIGPKSRVIVMDSTVPLGIYGIVDNVPWSVAWVGSITSRAGHAITNQMETLLSGPENLSYQKSGMMFGSTILSQSARWRSLDPNVQELLVNYMKNCMVDGVNLGLVDLTELKSSGDLFSFVRANAPNSLAFHNPIADQTQTCRDGALTFSRAVSLEAQNLRSQKAASAFNLRPGDNLPAAANKLDATLSDFQNLIGMTSATAVSTIRQAMLVNSMDDAVQQLIASSGNNAAMTAYQTARTEAQTSASYSAVGISALKWVPLLKIVFESIYYAAFPLAMLMMMTPMVWTVLKGYFGGFVWLAAWDPLTAVLHSIVMKASSGYYREAMGSYSVSGGIDYSMTFANFLGVRAVEQDVGTIAGYLMMSVPFMSFAVLFGATRMAGLATSMLNVSQGAAIESGREAATGNISLANASMNNFAANKWNTSSVYDVGAHTARMANGAMRTVNADGSAVFGAGSAQSSGGMSTRVGQTVREEVQDRREEAVRNATSLRNEWNTSVNDVAANYADFGRSLASGTSVTNDSSTSQTQRRAEDAREAHNAVQSFADAHGISLEAAYKAAIVGGVKGGSGQGGSGFSLGLDGAIAGTGIDSDTFTRLASAARESGLSETVSRYDEAVQALRSSEHSNLTETENGGERWSVEEVRRTGENYAEAVEEAQTLSAAESTLYSQGISYDGQLTDAIIGEWREAGASDEQISAWLNPKSTAGVKAQEAAVERVLPNLLNELGLDMPNRDLASAHTLRRPEEHISQHPLPSLGVNHERSVSDANASIDWRSDTLTERGDILREQAIGRATDNERSVVEGQNSGIVPGAIKKTVTTAGDVLDGLVDARSTIGSAITGRPSLSYYDRDVMIRTIAGEAAGETETGQAAVAHVIMNRAQDPRWGDNPAEASLEVKQFSAWNSGAGGNSIPENLKEGSPQYEQIGRIVDAVAAGYIPDPTGGATHYYSPEGMAKLVTEGHQTNEVPRWLNEASAERNYNNVTIGGHIFTGLARTGK
ncbi:conjugal transfer protein TraG N-terminal domain-containing protein [Epibacterium sp. DP7N7-1]|nr:conjugal transfer protein TraG N-terminal domain-containing protein [Epibacterium sp. DP7N7-1]